MYRKPNTGVVVMETAKDRGRFDAPISLNRARDRCIFTQGHGSVGHVSLEHNKNKCRVRLNPDAENKSSS